jgi:hypothetical protein
MSGHRCNPAVRTEPAGDAAALRRAARQIRDGWITAAVHSLGSTIILLATGINIVLAAHLPVASAGAILLLGAGVRRGSRVAAALLVAAALTPALIKLIVGALHPADLPAFPLAFLYARALTGAIRHHRLRRRAASAPHSRAGTLPPRDARGSR